MREIRTLRAMWRALETGSRRILNGHEEGNLGHKPRRSLRATAPALDPTASRRKCSGPACTPVFPPTTSRRWRCRAAPCGSMPPGGAGPLPCKSARWLRCGQARSPRETAGSRPPSGDRSCAGVAAGPLGPVGNGSAGDPSGTGASRGRVRFADRGAGPDHARRSSDGWIAGDLCGVRKGDPAGTNSGWPGPCAGERETAGPAGNGSRACCGNPETTPRGVSKSEIARRLDVGRTSVRRILDDSSQNIGPLAFPTQAYRKDTILPKMSYSVVLLGHKKNIIV